MTETAVLALIDAAPAFVDVQPLAGEDLRRAGLVALDELLGILRTAEGEQRAVCLQSISERVGSIVGAEAVNEAFAKAALQDAGASIGLIRELGAKAVKAAIAAGIKLGKAAPRPFTGPALAATDAFKSQPRPGASGDGNSAADRIPSSRDTETDASAPDSAEALAKAERDDAAAARAAAPAPPVSEAIEDASSQMGVSADGDARGGGAGRGDPPGEDDDARHMRLAFFPLTDLGNAERFCDRWRGKLLFNTALATTSPGRQRGWLAWDDQRWHADRGAERVMIAEHETVRLIQDEAKAVRASGCKDAAEPAPGARDFIVDAKKGLLYSDKIAQWGRTSESAQKLGALSKRGAPYLAVGIRELDADKLKINVKNGTLTVSRRDDGDYVQFGPHDPADLITKLAPVTYDPTASAPEFEKFLARVQPDPTMRRFLQQWFGLSLTGDTSPHKLVFLYGKGRNGKSVLVNIVAQIAGDYAQSVPIETFLDQGKVRAGGQATPDLAKLPGVRLLRTSEPEKNARLAEALIKLVTGGEPMDARHLQGDFFSFTPEFKLTIQGNYKPVLTGTDEGIKSRLLLVPFNVTIPKEERDPRLAEKLLSAEASGILNWMLDGLRSWLDGGLSEPEEVVSATAKFFEASDALGRFLEVCTIREEGSRVQSSVLHQVYEAWCKSSGETPWKNKGFSAAMDERGYERKQSNVMWWLDIKLIKSVNDFVDYEGNPLRFSKGDEQEEAHDAEF